MPESPRDRPSKAHEYIFLFSQSESYYYDQIAVREKASQSSLRRIGQSTFDSQTGGDKDYAKTGINKNRSQRKTLENFALNPGRNRRTVWTIPVYNYSGAHFATYPPKLIEPCVKASTSAHGACAICGSQWIRKVDRISLQRHELDPSDPRYRPNRYTRKRDGAEDYHAGGGQSYTQNKTIGWEAACNCDAVLVSPTILDPFNGAGTTGVVALQYNCNYIGIDLNPSYLELSRQRLEPITLEANGTFKPLIGDDNNDDLPLFARE